MQLTFAETVEFKKTYALILVKSSIAIGMLKDDPVSYRIKLKFMINFFLFELNIRLVECNMTVLMCRFKI